MHHADGRVAWVMAFEQSHRGQGVCHVANFMLSASCHAGFSQQPTDASRQFIAAYPERDDRDDGGGESWSGSTPDDLGHWHIHRPTPSAAAPSRARLGQHEPAGISRACVPAGAPVQGAMGIAANGHVGGYPGPCGRCRASVQQDGQGKSLQHINLHTTTYTAMHPQGYL